MSQRREPTPRGRAPREPVRWDPARTAAWLRIPGPADDKYRRGVLGARIGSSAYPGAAVLGVTAAWRAGVGLLRYTPPFDRLRADHGLPSPAAAVLAARPETVFGDPGARPCDAWLVGSGTDPEHRSGAESAELRTILTGDAPVVVDAGALGLAAESALEDAGRLAPSILTPHRGEFERLWQACGLGSLPQGWPLRSGDACADTEDSVLASLAAGAAALAEQLGATVLLKGSVTVVVAPGGAPILVGPATPWLATAGTGDVLAGVLGALVAGHAESVRSDPSLLADIGASAAHLHDAAARVASADIAETAPTAGRPITALDVADALPAAFARLRSAV